MDATYRFKVKNSLKSLDHSLWVIASGYPPQEIKTGGSALTIDTSEPFISIKATDRFDINEGILIKSPFDFVANRRNDFLEVNLISQAAGNRARERKMETETEEETTVEVGTPQ